MSMHLSTVPHPHAAGRTRPRLLCAYENGSVTMREYTREDNEASVEGIGWDVLWTVRLHVESGASSNRTSIVQVSVNSEDLSQSWR